MNATAIDYIWKAILESERSDEFPFMDREKLTMAVSHVTPQPQPDQSSTVSREPITVIAINPKPAAGDSPQTATVPPLPQP
jgi:hypothetical protein